MEVFRLSRAVYAHTLSGKGAAIRGARWNSKGIELIYTACNRSLAMAEVAVHFTLATLPGDYRMITVYVPEDIAMKEIPETDLPDEWNIFPHPLCTQQYGNDFVSENKFCLLKIPSAVTKGDYNILINPSHGDFSRIKILESVDFPFDRRIFKPG